MSIFFWIMSNLYQTKYNTYASITPHKHVGSPIGPRILRKGLLLQVQHTTVVILDEMYLDHPGSRFHEPRGRLMQIMAMFFVSQKFMKHLLLVMLLFSISNKLRDSTWFNYTYSSLGMRWSTVTFHDFFTSVLTFLQEAHWSCHRSGIIHDKYRTLCHSVWWYTAACNSTPILGNYFDKQNEYTWWYLTIICRILGNLFSEKPICNHHASRL